jgi:hypothetical protein
MKLNFQFLMGSILHIGIFSTCDGPRLVHNITGPRSRSTNKSRKSFPNLSKAQRTTKWMTERAVGEWRRHRECIFPILEAPTLRKTRRNRKRPEKMQRQHRFTLTQLLSFILLPVVKLSILTVESQNLPPARYDGFVYENRQGDLNSILVEAFFDPVCPDSRDSWPPLKEALKHYGSRVWLVVHLLPLPWVIFSLFFITKMGNRNCVQHSFIFSETGKINNWRPILYCVD